jgi:hypothetical protein
LKLAILLIALNGVIFAAHAASTVLGLFPGQAAQAFFDMGDEGNIPTWFASLLWFGVALSAVRCYQSDRLQGRSLNFVWLLISVGYLFASCDEVTQIHEYTGALLQNALQENSSFGWLTRLVPNSPWIVFLGPFLALGGIASAIFWWQRFKSSQVLLLLITLAVECYGLAAANDFLQGSPHAKQQLASSINIQQEVLEEASVAVEEVLENFANILLILAFLYYADRSGTTHRQDMFESTLEPAALDESKSES